MLIMTFGLAVVAAQFVAEVSGEESVAKTETASENIEFRRQVLPIISKLGCNSGACHGALAGKGGFKLSLNGYDPTGDHFNITQQSLGRRIEMADPGRSLLLTKPTGSLPHKGGLRMEVDSLEYRLLSQWIAQGAVGPGESDPQIERLVVEPNQAVLSMGEKRQLNVKAVYDNGLVEDVTRWSKFTSTLSPVVTVDGEGMVRVVGQGEGSVVVWFSSQLAVSTITSPFQLNCASGRLRSIPAAEFYRSAWTTKASCSCD